MMKTTTLWSIIMICSLVTLVGCFQATPVRQYVLITEPIPTALAHNSEPMTILLGPVKLANYLDQPRIVRRHGPTRIDSLTGHQWAGDLTEMISNKLIAELGGLLKPARVLSYPGPAGQGRRVSIDILRFEGTDDKNAIIEANWTIFDLESKKMIKTQSSLIQVLLPDDSFEALTTALSKGLTQLGQEIAASIVIMQK